MQNCFTSGWFSDISYCQGFDFDPFSEAKDMILALSLCSQGCMVAKTRAAHPRQNFSDSFYGLPLNYSQAFTWTDALVLFKPLRTDLSKIWNKMQISSCKKMHMKTIYEYLCLFT